MKKLAILALLLSLGSFSLGCDKGKKAPEKPMEGTPPADAPAADPAAPAGAPADAPK